MSFEVMVKRIFLSSCIVLRDSDMTMRVPSDLTTLSKGVMRKAKGSLSRKYFSISKAIRSSMFATICTLTPGTR